MGNYILFLSLSWKKKSSSTEYFITSSLTWLTSFICYLKLCYLYTLPPAFILYLLLIFETSVSFGFVPRCWTLVAHFCKKGFAVIACCCHLLVIFSYGTITIKVCVCAPSSQLGSWVGFTVMTQCAPVAFFTLVAFIQMTVWAKGKHRSYLKEFRDYPTLRSSILPFIL